jgi:hypothetical protein
MATSAPYARPGVSGHGARVGRDRIQKVEQEEAKKACAYCGSEGVFTREHIWPRGIIRRAPDYEARYFGKVDKVLSSEHVTRDVCADCNNGALSELDEYGCLLFDNYFCQSDIAKTRVHFKYDYDLLLRWLLKISYNSSRSVGVDTEHLRRCVPYIVGAEARIRDVWLFAILIEPLSRIADGMHKVVPPQGVRAARVGGAEEQNLPFIVRLVGLNAFYFLIVITKEGEKADFALARRSFRGKQLARIYRSVLLTPSGLNTYDVWKGHLEDKDHLYREHFARRRSETGKRGKDPT